MKNFSRYDRMLAMILTFAMIAGASACKHKTKTTETSVSESATEASTSESETTETTETTEATTTTESTAVPESTDPSDTSETAVPSDNTSSTPAETTVAPADPTKAPATPKPSMAPKATSAPKPTTAPATSTPTATPTTKPTDTPTPVPAETTPKSKDPGLRKSTGISAAKAAVQDKCGSHDGFEFNDTVMSNEQARAKACADNQYFYSHNSISGTFVPLEAAAMFTGYIFDDGTELYEYDAHGSTKSFDNFYDCLYSLSSFLVTEHTAKLSSDSSNKYYGVGFAGYKDSWTEQEYGIITYQYYLYIGGDSDIFRGEHGY